jgi:hypothetical protein
MRLAHKCALLAALAAALSAAPLSDITPEHYMAHITYLASPALKGRLTGTPELDQAADYIAAQFRNLGVKPVNGTYFQDFEVTARTALGPDDRLSIDEGTQHRDLQEQTDFIPLNLSANGTVSGAVAFAGYGITAPEYHYDDYGGLDVHDKIVLVLRHEPQEADPKSVFDGKNYTVHSRLDSKVVNAKLHGARGILLVNDAPSHPGAEDELERFAVLTATEDYGIEAAQIASKQADDLLGHAHESLAQAIQEIDRDTKPHSFAFGPGVSATLKVDLKQEMRHTRNVVGFVPGSTAEYVIIGAHYDHLGLGEQNSMAPSLVGTIHPGADDNASGTAGVIELSRHFAALSPEPRGFLFLCFAGEEEGLLGSAWYVAHPLKPLADAVAMINMDMIGRVRDNKVYVGGEGTGSTFKPLIAAATEHEGFIADQSEIGGYGASDHTSFTNKQIPALFFFSGLHGDYHKPSDTADKINAKDATRLLDEIAEVVDSLATAPVRPQFVHVQAPAHSGDPSSGGGSGYGPDFGSIPDFGGPANGVRFSGVRDDSPAAKAGFKAGDVLVEFGGKPIQNLYDFTYALRAHKPGDVVKVKVLRDGQPFEAEVLLTKRK